MDNSIFPIDEVTADRLNAACKIIEYDGAQGYWTVRNNFGENIANAIIVMWLRQRLNSNPDQFPCPPELARKVKETLRQVGLLSDAAGTPKI